MQAGSVQDLLARGIYLTTAVKCAKTGYGIERSTVAACSQLLEKELALFPNVKAYLLMGDIPIQAFNAVARRAGAGRVIPAGSTYKIRGGDFTFRGARVYPSYLQAGPSFFIEKSKRRMFVSGSDWADFETVERTLLENRELAKKADSIEEISRITGSFGVSFK